VSIKNFFIISFLLVIGHGALAISAASAQSLDQSLLNTLMSGFSGAQNSQAPPASSISQNDVFLSWSANTNVPFGYEGKPLPVYGSVISVSLVSAKNSVSGLDKLIYRWYLDDDFQDYASNSNRQTFLFRVKQISGSSHTIRVEVLDKSGASLFVIEKIISVSAPQAVIYASDKESGWTEKFSQEPTLSPGKEQIFVALPYFFSAVQPSQLDFQWDFNGQSVTKTSEKNKFDVRAAEGELTESFTKELSVLITNPMDEMQRATGKIEIEIQK
jgi:hypothetical protein